MIIPGAVPLHNILPDRSDPGRPPFTLWFIEPGRAIAAPHLARLPGEELARAARLYDPELRERYLRVRGILRHLIEHELGPSAGCLHFTTNRWGKPRVAEAPDLHFNISYSGNAALIGIARDHEIGVDLEETREIRDAREIAGLCFAPDEAACPDSAFLTGWTRKEALLKAIGQGFSMKPDRVACGVAHGERVVRHANTSFRVSSGPLVPGYTVAWAWRC